MAIFYQLRSYCFVHKPGADPGISERENRRNVYERQLYERHSAFLGGGGGGGGGWLGHTSLINFDNLSTLRCNLVHSERLNLANAYIYMPGSHIEQEQC